MPKSAYEKLIQAGVKHLEITTPQISLTLDLETLKAIYKDASGSQITIDAEKADLSKLSEQAKKALGSRPAYVLAIMSNGKSIRDFEKGRVAITLPYKPNEKERNGSLFLVYVDDAGKTEYMTNSAYSQDLKSVIGKTNHFSVYGIGFKENLQTFSDLKDHWAKNDIEFVTARGLFSGTGDGKFSPDAAMTRGMFVTALGRLAEADISSYKTSKFTDVKADAYYLPYIEWANKNGIVKGTSDTTFAPDQQITREQMAVMMVNYAKVIGFELPKVHTENIFADDAKISSYAKTAVKQMQMAGVISGKNGNLFDPQGTATRAEASAVLKRFVELVISRDTAQGWMQNDNGKWLYYKDGKAITGKQTIGGVSYTFNQYGESDIQPQFIFKTYTVKKGDTFWKIALEYKVNMFTLAKVNGKSIFSLIYEGEELKIPN